MTFYQQSTKDALENLKSTEQGLSSEEARKRQQENGFNQLEAGKEKGFFEVFASQFADLLVVILIVAALISMVSGHVESTLVIFAVIIANAILGTVQHFKAQQSLNSLKAMSSPMAKVFRDGKRDVIDACQLTIGDIVILEAGDIVPADGRIIENNSLQVNESSLTGESEAVVKTIDAIETNNGENIALGDKTNMVYSGSLVTNGRAKVLITAIGMETEIGKIATFMNDTKERKTPLQVSLDNFSKKLSIIILVICALIFALSIYRQMPMLDSLMFAVALAVAAIPEALSSIVTIALAIGTSKMTKENAVIKNLKAVEGLGCVSIICSDKTGTLTQNKMTVQGDYTLGVNHRSTLLLSSVLCNDSYLNNGEVVGDPTETALITSYIKECGDNEENNYEKILSSYPRIAEVPFDSIRKLMSTLNVINGENTIFTKGAVDVLTNRLTNILDNGNLRPITATDIENIKTQNQIFSDQGLRVLAFATKKSQNPTLTLEDEHDLTFIGLISMIDPPRPESKAAVADCYTAGIKPIMITGDHIVTASAIAREIGILKDGDRAITGVEVDKMTDEQLLEILPEISVYARVSPENKIRIVEMWQSKGEIVAMTGDGVNDAPALKKADIGIAMGITGTEVSKDAASMILMDDNFATIIKSVENGRNIYANIKNSIKFLLSGNFSGLLTVVYTSLMALPVPFAAVHLLFINLLTDSLPAIAISTENSQRDLLNQKPRGTKESILTKDFMTDIAVQGSLIGVFTIIAYHIGLTTDNATASTMAFATLCLARLWHGFNCRGKKSIFKLGIATNKASLAAFAIGVIFLATALFVPFFQQLFEVAVLSQQQLLYVAALAFAPTLIIQTVRVIKELKHS